MRDAVDEAISCGVLEDTMDDDQTCPESVLLVLMERAFRDPTHEGVRILDWQPQLKRVLQCVRENDPVYGVLRDDIERLRAENDALREALAHYATDETQDGWIAIAALAAKEE